MGINKLRHFITVYELGSIRRAAELLHMSSGSLSKSLKTLEEEMGQKLFLADGRNIRPSDWAQTIYEESKNLVERYQKLTNVSLHGSQDERSLLRIGSWEVFTTYFMARFLSDEKELAHKVRVLERPPEVLEQSLLDNELDVGITYAPVPHPNLEYLPITRFYFRAFARKDFIKSMGKKETIPFAIPITMINNSPLGVKTLDHWPVGKDRVVKYEFEMLETALETTRMGLNAIYCPDFIIPLQNHMLQKEFSLVPMEELKSYTSQTMEIFIVKRKSSPESAEIKKLAKAIRKYCG